MTFHLIDKEGRYWESGSGLKKRYSWNGDNFQASWCDNRADAEIMARMIGAECPEHAPLQVVEGDDQTGRFGSHVVPASSYF